MKAGRYELHEMLGIGAFATVYRAHDPRLDAEVAVKVLADNWSQDIDIRGRFRSEAVLLRRVQREADVPGLVDVFDIGETEDGQPYFVMSYADRGTLAERSEGKAWPVEDVWPIVDVLGDTIGALHATDVVHRDLKPSNLLLRADRNASTEGSQLIRHGERLLVGDLGLAKDSSVDTSRLSLAGGTMRYMSPEQLVIGGAIDGRSDVYSASVLIAELLAGTADLPAVGAPLAGELPATIPAATRDVLDRGLQPDVADRQQSMAQWRTELAATMLPSDSAPIASQGRRAGQLAAALGVVAAVVAGLVLLLTRGGGLDVVGPDQLVVGEQVSFSVGDGSEATWTDWTGQSIQTSEFEVQASLPGRLRFTVTTPEETVSHSVTVVESALGPSITGPGQVQLGQTAVFTATTRADDTSVFWIDPDGTRVEGDTLRVVVRTQRELVVSLVAVGGDGVERGSRQIVTVQS